MATAIKLTNVTKQYGKATKPAVSKVSINIQAGEVYGFLGSNGAGKSTTIRMLLNFLRPTDGTATILGMDSVTDSVAIKKVTGYLAGDVAMYPKASGAEFLQYAAKLQGLRDLSYQKDLIARFEAQTSKKMGELSKGNRQKIGIIQAFMHKPKVLILDEPTSGLDPVMQDRFYQTVLEAKQRGAAVFLSSHSFAEVEKTCDRVGIIQNGVLVKQGTLAELAPASAKPVFTVTFNGKPPASLRKSKHLTVIDAQGSTVKLTPKDAIAPVLSELGGCNVASLQVEHQNLEQEFMNFYKSDKSEAA